MDDILLISGLIEIETEPSGRGRDKIYYIVHDPLSRDEFREKESDIRTDLLRLIEKKSEAGRIVGKEVKPKRKGRNTTNQ